MRELLTEKANKEKEKAQNWKTKCEESELKLTKMKEEMQIKLSE